MFEKSNTTQECSEVKGSWSETCEPEHGERDLALALGLHLGEDQVPHGGPLGGCEAGRPHPEALPR